MYKMAHATFATLESENPLYKSQVSKAVREGHEGGWGLLYHLSMEDSHKPLFMPLLPLVYRRLMAAESLRNAPELLALAVNLTHDPAVAGVRAITSCHSQPAQCLCQQHCLLVLRSC